MPRIDQLPTADLRPREERDFYDTSRLSQTTTALANESSDLTVKEMQELIVSPDEVEAAVSSAVHYDVEHMDAAVLLHPEVATEQALKAYDLYVSDTNYPPEAVVAYYVHELINILGAEDPEVTQSEVDKFVEDVEAFVKKLDFELSVDKLEPVTTKS